MTLLSADAIFAADDMVYEDVPVPEWGGEVRVSVMTGAERDELEHRVLAEGKTDDDGNIRDQRGFRELCLSLACRDANNERIFSDEDVVRLSRKNSDVIDRLWAVCRRLNKLGKQEQDALKKNSAAPPSGGSGTT